MKKCYMCDADGVTKEHVPPYSFFPKGYKDNLWTVPSCDEHNSKNNLDVEYVRNVIATHLHTEGSAGTHLQDKVLGSFENSPKLFNRTFADANVVKINGEETASYTLDMRRFTKIMDAIAYAIYYKLNGKSYQDSWGIFSPSLISRKTFYHGLPDDWEEHRRLLSQIRYTEMPTPQPDIFRLGIHKFDEEHFIYAFMFYGGFVVNCLGLDSSLMPPNNSFNPTPR
jgi:hypothetical protein